MHNKKSMALSWSPQIGDPTFMGWFTVFFYFITAFTALRKAVIFRKNPTDFRFWGVLAILLFLLGINKQLDIQSLFTEIGRFIAKRQGWYQKRRSVQVVFIIIFGCVALTAIISVWLMLRKKWRSYLVPLIGFLLLISFVFVRAASFHHFDTFINKRPLGAKMNWVLELGGIGILFFSTLLKPRKM